MTPARDVQSLEIHHVLEDIDREDRNLVVMELPVIVDGPRCD